MTQYKHLEKMKIKKIFKTVGLSEIFKTIFSQKAETYDTLIRRPKQIIKNSQ